MDFNGSFLARIRDLAGANPIILVVTKVIIIIWVIPYFFLSIYALFHEISQKIHALVSTARLIFFRKEQILIVLAIGL